jgi:hypothetical protein
MGFLTDQFDLSDTVFSAADLKYSRQFLESAMARPAKSSIQPV